MFRTPRASTLIPTILAVPVTLHGLVLAEPQVQDLGAGQYRVTFKFVADEETRTVHLAGSFNGWDMTAAPMSGPDEEGRFTLTLQLPAGRYEYKFVVDGSDWSTDPDNPNRVAPYDNAVLVLGPGGDSAPAGPLPATPPVNMAGSAAHPAEIEELLQVSKSGGSGSELSEWFAGHPLPLVHDQTVTFVLHEPKAESAVVFLTGRGYQTSYEVPRLGESPGLFALTLQRGPVPADAVYRFEAKLTNGRTKHITDPHAWTVTSRGGRPVAVVTAPDRARGRVELAMRLRPKNEQLKPRDVYVYLPPGYAEEPQRRYPVVYVHDGQNCWDDPEHPFGNGGWFLKDTADRLIRAGTVRPFIVVAVSNTPSPRDRLADYGPGPDVLNGAAHAYLQCLMTELKPAIDERYRTLIDAAHTASLGASLGGSISLQAAMLYPEVFGAAACMSPAFWVPDARQQSYYDLVSKRGKQAVRIYIDHGTAGKSEDGAPDSRRMVALLRQAGWRDGVELLHVEEPGARHSERAWRARLEKPLVFLFGVGQQGP